MQEQAEKIAIFAKWAANRRVQADEVIAELGGLPERFFDRIEGGFRFIEPPDQMEREKEL